MRLPHFEYLKAKDLSETLALIAGPGGKARILAGGTELLPLMRLGLSTPPLLVDVASVGELRGTSRASDTVRIGAATTLAELSASRDCRTFNALYEAVESVAAPPLRNTATIGGNLCQNSRCLFYNQSETWRHESVPCLKAGGERCVAVPGARKCFSVYQGDIAPAVMALGGSLRVEKKGSSRAVGITELFSGDAKRPIALEDDEIVAEILLPVPEQRTGSAYRKLRLRSAVDYPLLSVAAVIQLDENGTICGARIALGAAGPAPVRVREAEDLLVGKRGEEIDRDRLAKASDGSVLMVENTVAPASYRKRMAPVFVRRTVEAALASARRKEIA